MEKSNKNLEKMWKVILINYYKNSIDLEYDGISKLIIEPVDTTYCIVKNSDDSLIILFAQNHGHIQSEIVVDEDWA